MDAPSFFKGGAWPWGLGVICETADIREGQGEAFYVPSRDFISMPAFDAFKGAGAATLDSYRAATPFDLPLAHADWLRSLPFFHDDGKRFFVHAGVHPARSLDQQDPHDLLWIREPFLSSGKDFGRLIVHGHTPIPSGVPDLRANRLNIDTGAVYGRALTSAVFADHRTAPIKFLSAPSLQH
jgi:hypothetical protein